MSSIIDTSIRVNQQSHNESKMELPSCLHSPSTSVRTCPVTPSSSTRRSSVFSSVSSKSKRGVLLAKLVKTLSAPQLPLNDDDVSKKERYPTSRSLRSSFRNNKLPRLDSEETAASSQSPYEIDTSVMMMMDTYSFMTYRFPVTQKTEKLVFRKFGPNDRDTLIETSGGEIVGSIDYSSVKELGIRIIKDAAGRTCAVIKRKQVESNFGGPSSIYQVYGNKPSAMGQNPSNDDVVNGCYLWAQIKNTKAMGGGKFVMKRHSSSSSQNKNTSYSTQRFGGLFSKDKSSGFAFLDNEEKELVKMISLKDRRSKGIVIAPNCDTCLMLAFCAVVDEMVEKILI